MRDRVPMRCVKLTTISGTLSLDSASAPTIDFCPLGIAGSVGWRGLRDEIPIKNKCIESRCVECPDRIEWRIDDQLRL